MKFNNYDEYFKVYRDTPLRWEFWVRVLQRYKRKGKLLEIGCAEGYFLKRAKKYYNAFGIDISSKAIKKLRGEGFKAYKQSATNIKRFKSNFFDIIVIFDVLEHLRNPELCIKECARVLKKNGIIVISVPNTSSILRIFKKKNWFGYADRTHLSILAKKEWLNLLRKNNFKIRKVASDGFWDIPYFPLIPDTIQKIFLVPGYVQYKLNKLIIPPIGENLVVISEKR